MRSASALRSQIEVTLADRIPSALTPAAKTIREVMPTGIAAIDVLLDGGLPVGAVTEMIGGECSGRTALALSFVAQVTKAERVCAWIDVSNALSPESAAASGIDFNRLLWVRCGVQPTAIYSHSQEDFTLAEKYLAPPVPKKGLHGGGFGPHPRMEVKGMSDGISGLLRGDAIAPRCAEPQRRIRPERETFEPPSPQTFKSHGFSTPMKKPWSRIEQALRATDLLLQAGGFGAIVLDLGSIAPEHVSRIPLATWFRYRAAAERSRASVLLLNVGKALGFDQESLGRLSGLVSQWEWRGKTDTMAHSFQNAGFDLKHPRIAKYLELCMRIQDLPRHLGQHSGGMVICQGQLDCVVPLERASMPCRTVVQWDKEDCADLGIIKVDLLGLGMMAVLKDCIELIPRHYRESVDLAQLPEDEEVYNVLQQADTVGMFQVESRAQMASLPRNYPTHFYDLVVQVAIMRPGPIVGKMTHPYMRRRQKKEPVTYPHPSLEPVLKRTLGVPLFQEQLLRIAMTVANFSRAEAEELRRAVGMRRSWERMKNLEGKLRAGMTANGIDPATQENIIQNISSFALYGFPESHAASFALIAYASAYLKVKYLAAFTCAILNNQSMGFYMPAVLVKDAQRHGLRVRPIDIQVSDWACTIEHEVDGALSLRIGLGYARGLRRQSSEAVVAARSQDGHFRSAEDLSLRVPLLNRKELTLLARIGALNKLDGIEHRRDALWQVERAGKLEGPLLRQNSDWLREESNALPLAQMNTEERLVADYAGTGLTVGKHPMHYRRQELRSRNVFSAAELRRCRDGQFVMAVGCVIARQRPGTAKGFIFISMEDETGIANVIVTPDLYERERLTVVRSKFLLAEGILQNQDGVIHVKAMRLTAIGDNAMELRSHDFH